MTIKLNTVLVFCLLTVCALCKGQNLQKTRNNPPDGKAIATGEIVTEISKSIFIIFHAGNDDYWFGSDGDGVYKYDGKMLIHYSTKDGLSHDRIRGIQQDASGNIFFTTLGGICKYDGKRFTTLPAVESDVWKMEPGDLWFASNQDENGPYRYDGRSLYHLRFPKHYLEDEFYNRLPNPPYDPYQVYTTYKDSKGNIWFGTSTFGLCRYDGSSLSWLYERHLTRIGENGSFGIRSIIEDEEGKFWFCNSRYRYDINASDSLSDGYHFIAYKREQGVDKLKAPDGADHIYYMSVAEDKRGLWMATHSFGVWRYKDNNITHYPLKDGAKEITVYSIYKDRHGDLWLGTHANGAYKFNGKTFERFRP